jgi:hypothetical protein
MPWTEKEFFFSCEEKTLIAYAQIAAIKKDTDVQKQRSDAASV